MAAPNCSHLSLISALSHPKISQAVHREECTQCFDNQDLPAGIDLCLTCFNGGCPRIHAQIHAQKSNHPYTLNIRRIQNPDSTNSASRDDNEPPAKMTKLAIQEEPSEKEKYQFLTTIKCWMCEPVQGLPVPEAAQDAKIKALIEACLSSLSSARQSEVKAWEEEISPCEHTLTLNQCSSGPIADSGLAHCADCHLTANLWLCLTCGSLGCGRQQFGGLEGNGHGLKHFEATHHPVAVKLGTITPEGDADIYCYACNDTKEDPNIATHLDAFGIHIHSLKKTEKSMTELQIEQNLNYDFSLTSHSGEALEPVHGPGLTGLANLGNSCYIASTLQTIFALPAFQKRYYLQSSSNDQPDTAHAQECTYALPAECIECQMRKVADGLLSGRYAIPVQPPPKPSETITQDTASSHSSLAFQAGIRPMMFKSLIGANHAEFSTMRQQDAEEFFGHLISIIRRDSKRRGIPLTSDQDATRVFVFGTEQRIKCNVCGRVRYRIDEMDRAGMAVPAVPVPDPVPPETEDQSTPTEAPKKKEYKPVSLQSCIDSVFLSQEALEYTCPGGCGSVIATKQTRFASFPDVLVIHTKKFELVNWVPTKLDIPVILPENDTLLFDDKYLGKGLQSGEVELRDDSDSGGGGGRKKPALPPVDEDLLQDMEEMGFSRISSEKALRATGNTDLEAAMGWVFAHMDDADIDDPETGEEGRGGGGGGGGGKPEPPKEMVAMLTDMGFTDKQAKKSLRETDLNMERAVEWLFSHPDDNGENDRGDDASSSSAVPTTSQSAGGSREVPAQFVLKAFVSHKGPSVHSGHYVAHVKVPMTENQQGEWVLFNDEKVVKADRESIDELKTLAYLYIFERVEGMDMTA